MLVPAGSVLLFWSIIIYHRSIIICLDRHVDFSFRYTLRTVDHNWPTVDHDWAWSCTTSWSIIICHTKLKLSGQTSSTFHLMGSLISNHILYIERSKIWPGFFMPILGGVQTPIFTPGGGAFNDEQMTIVNRYFFQYIG